MSADVRRFTVPQVAERWANCSTRFVLDEIRRKNLRAEKLAGRWVVAEPDLVRYERAHGNIAEVRGRAS